VAEVERLGGAVLYDWQADRMYGYLRAGPSSAEPSGPRWIRQLIGDDYFGHVVKITLPPRQRVFGMYRLAKADVGPEVTDDDLKLVGSISTLEELDLTKAPIGDAGILHLAHLENLRTLHLKETKVTDAGLPALGTLRSLWVLRLDHTRITAAGLIGVQGLKDLERLDLDGTKIGDSDLGHFTAFVRLRRLSLYHTQVTSAGVDQLQNALPDCRLSSQWESYPPRRGKGPFMISSLSEIWLDPAVGIRANLDGLKETIYTLSDKDLLALACPKCGAGLSIAVERKKGEFPSGCLDVRCVECGSGRRWDGLPNTPPWVTALGCKVTTKPGGDQDRIPSP
jgi:hypothetical protein